jgi:hypothetical protein
MGKVALFSALLIAGLLGSQLLPGFAVDPLPALQEIVRVLTMRCLGFIMIHVGYEFEIDRANIGAYAVDYGVAATAAAFPWIFCAIYFVFVLDSGPVGEVDTWRDALLTSRFAAPTSAGILFSMLAAAGLSASWVFAKARVLAIFDDLDTVLLMIPLKMWIVGLQWQLAAIALVMGGLLWLAWRTVAFMRSGSKVPSGVYHIVELLVEFLWNTAEGTAGKWAYSSATCFGSRSSACATRWAMAVETPFPISTASAWIEMLPSRPSSTLAFEESAPVP